jgi:thiopurine S-methyltransferase
MEHEFWHRRWANKEIGFHEGSVNKYLYKHWPELAGKGTGVELSDIACKDFFEEVSEKAMVHPGEPFTVFRHDHLQIWNGDFFQLVPADLSHVRLVYDRAALIALPPDIRRKYVEHLTAVTPDNTHTLLITLDYEGSPTSPPFNVSNDEVYELYAEDYHIEHIHTQTLARDHPFAKRKGLNDATESVFRLTRR